MPGPATQAMERQNLSTELACRLGLPLTGFGHGKRRRRIHSNTGMLFLMYTSKGTEMGLSQNFRKLSNLPCHSVLCTVHCNPG